MATSMHKHVLNLEDQNLCMLKASLAYKELQNKMIYLLVVVVIFLDTR